MCLARRNRASANGAHDMSRIILGGHAYARLNAQSLLTRHVKASSCLLLQVYRLFAYAAPGCERQATAAMLPQMTTSHKEQPYWTICPVRKTAEKKPLYLQLRCRWDCYRPDFLQWCSMSRHAQTPPIYSGNIKQPFHWQKESSHWLPYFLAIGRCLSQAQFALLVAALKLALA